MKSPVIIVGAARSGTSMMMMRDRHHQPTGAARVDEATGDDPVLGVPQPRPVDAGVVRDLHDERIHRPEGRRGGVVAVRICYRAGPLDTRRDGIAVGSGRRGDELQRGYVEVAVPLLRVIGVVDEGDRDAVAGGEVGGADRPAAVVARGDVDPAE